jgi:hypothetical protein
MLHPAEVQVQITISFKGLDYVINKKFWGELIAYFPLKRHGWNGK